MDYNVFPFKQNEPEALNLYFLTKNELNQNQQGHIKLKTKSPDASKNKKEVFTKITGRRHQMQTVHALLSSFVYRNEMKACYNYCFIRTPQWRM